MPPKFKRTDGKKSFPPADRSQDQDDYMHRLRTNIQKYNRFDDAARNTATKYFVMYGLADKKAFTVHIGNRMAFESGGQCYSFDTRSKWIVGEDVVVNYGGQDVQCKIGAICSNSVEAKEEEKKLIEKFTMESIYGSDYMVEDERDDSQRKSPSESSSDGDGDFLEYSNGDGGGDGDEDDDEDVINQRKAKKHKGDYDQRRKFEMERLKTQAQMPPREIIPNNCEDISAMLSKVVELAEGNSAKLNELKEQLERQEKNHDRDMKAIWRAIRRLEKKATLDSSAIAEQSASGGEEVSSFFKPEDNLLWMGENASTFFNELLVKYNGDFNKFMHRLALEMWGDRVCYYYFIPSGSRSKSGTQRRELLFLKDPTGVVCLKRIIDKILTAQERVKIEALTGVGQDIDGKMRTYIRNHLSLDRQKQLSSISQLGLDFKNNRKQLVSMAHYYTLLEIGAKPTDKWTVRDEVFDDTFYRERSSNAQVKEGSVIIEAAQVLYNNRTNEEATKRIIEDYKILYPFFGL